MTLVHRDSLAATVDAVNGAFFHGRRVSAPERKEAALAIARRQGRPGSYREMFAPFTAEAKSGIRLFTGEKVPPGAGARHILGEEACRALLLLNARAKAAGDALDRASAAILQHADEAKPLSRSDPVPGPRLLPGMYCCMKCSTAVWRHFAVRGGSAAERFLSMGIDALRAHRSGDGRWRAWPFHYVLLTLTEIDLPKSRREMKYAARECERQLARRTSRTDVYSGRRRAVMEKALAMC